MRAPRRVLPARRFWRWCSRSDSLAEKGVVVGERRLGPVEVAQPLGQLEQRLLRRPLTASGEQRDRAAVVGASGERATDGELNAGAAELAAQEQHVDHLPCRLGDAVALLERVPELVEAARPAATLALLLQWQRPLQRPWLQPQKLEVVVELGSGLIA